MNRRCGSMMVTLTVVAAVLVPGCAVGPKYERPEIAMPGEWRERSGDGRSIADLQWRELFKDEVLVALISEALENNKDVLIAAARIEEFRGTHRAAFGARLPQVDVAGDFERSQASQQLSPNARPENGYRVAGQISWEIDIWGKLKHASEAARADWLASEAGYRAVTLTLISDVAFSYFAIQDLDRQIEITEQTIDSRKRSRDIARKRFEGGLTSELEVKQTDSELASAMAVLPRARNELRRTENALSVLLGRHPAATPRGRNRDGMHLPPEVPAGLPNALIKRRPDILQSEQELIAASHRVGMAVADLYPSLSLSGEIGRESSDASTLFDRSGLIWSTAASAVAPIFSAGQLRGRRDAAQARFEQAGLGYEQAVLNALREANDALSSYQESIGLREAQEHLVVANQDYARLALARYLNGEESYLQYLDAERKLFNAEIALSESVRDQYSALVSVYKALGGGWSPSETQD